MLDAFEARLAELLTDRLDEVAGLAGVVRPGGDGTALGGDTLELRVRIVDARPMTVVGDDARARLGERGAWRERVTLALEGRVELELRIGEAGDAAASAAQRGQLVGVLDRLLVCLADEGVRSGLAFAKATDQGFELDGFRLAQVQAPDAGEGALQSWRVEVDYQGRFWPVGEEQAGVAIAALPIRTAVLPAGLPSGASVRAGETLELPVRVALESLHLGAEADGGEGPPRRIMARLRGASPGELLGDAAPGAEGFVGYAVDPAGEIRVRYAAPDAVVGKAEARIELALERPAGGRVGLGELRVEVRE